MNLRSLALDLPGTTVLPHFERWSARVGGRIYATWPQDVSSVNLFFPPEVVSALLAASPSWLTELRWGAKVVGVTVAGAPPELVAALLEDAWRRRAPRRLQPK